MQDKILYIRFCLRERSGTYMCTILEKLRYKTPMNLLTEYNISPEPPVNLPELLERIL